MAFWSTIVKPGSKPTPFVPPPENWTLHISTASLPATVPEGQRVSVQLKHDAEDPEGVILCTLTAGRLDTVTLDLFLDRYAEFQLLGNANTPVHLTGYFSPPDELAAGLPDSDEDEDYEEEDEMMVDNPLAMLTGDSDDDEDEDDEDDEGEDDSDDEPGVTRRPHVTIQEVKDEEEEPKKGKAKAKADQKPAQTPKQAPPTANGKDKQTPATAGQKRAAEEPAQPASNKKQAQEAAKQQQAQAKQDKAAKSQPSTPGAAGEVKSGKQNIRTWENGFSIQDLAMGQPNGKLAKSGKRVMMKYVGRLKNNGKVFDQTKGNKPFTFRLGVGEVIKGWDLGVEGMRVGDKRRLVIPPQLAYGSGGVKGAIPPNATLEFDVELVDVK